MTILPNLKSSGLLLFIALVTLAGFVAAEEVSGIIIPRDNKGMYVRNDEGQFEVSWTPRTRVALMSNTRQFKNLADGKFNYAIHSSKEVVTFAVPPGPITGIKTSKKGGQLEKALREATEEKWLAEHGLSLHFGVKPNKEQLASPDDPRFIGTWDPTTKPRTLSINGEKLEISLKKGGQATIPLYGILTVKDLKPFVNQAAVFGKRQGDVIVAEEIRMRPIGDQAALDDPDLPRYLFIGDSISGNYDKGLRAALAGKFNLHHPPTNCGPSGNGAKNIVNWLGAYDQPGRHWDVISFNHGHWDAGNDKATYQANLEKVITQLKKTGAKLIWVTTCPVPNGYDSAGPLDDRGKAPGRLAGVMEKYLNPWAAEVMARHPEITVCDQWQFVKDNEGGLYTDWWGGKNVHFGGEPADALGRFLADHVINKMADE
jgi:acyl-CoA thioesterase-1